MPTFIPIPLTAQQMLDVETRYRTSQTGVQIAFACLMIWAVAMLLVGATARFGADAATLDTFDLIATF